jgi:tRNA dimethylallyltransferase
MTEVNKPDMITLLGPTAVGKTSLAARLACEIHGEIISADSRQVYKRMNLGTGKDLNDYLVNGKVIPYHLIDIADPGYEYSLYEFVCDFESSYQYIVHKPAFPILCGGTGLYLDAILRGYQLSKLNPDTGLKSELEIKTDHELIKMLSGMRNLHNRTDIEDRARLIRAIEVASLKPEKSSLTIPKNKNALVFGLRFERATIRKRITLRLKQRLDMGMIDEVSRLIEEGIPVEKLLFYGLEYKYLALYVTGKISFEEMFGKLNTSIHQFAKRQMTWFRRMERQGVLINWLEGEDGEDQNLNLMLEKIRTMVSPDSKYNE